MAVLHTIKASLYENLLTDDRNDFTAWVSAERSLGVRDICQSAVERGGADINAAAMEQQYMVLCTRPVFDKNRYEGVFINTLC